MRVEMLGKKFERLLVLQADGRDARGSRMWTCQCECGSVRRVRTSALTSGNTKSCGCLQMELVRQRMAEGTNGAVKRTHGHVSGPKWSPTYATWAGMIARCTNPKAINYERYGGRGIAVCEAWMTFDRFLADMGERPADLTLDRIDNDGNYEPGNCKWSTRSEQARNRRKKRQFTPGDVPATTRSKK